MTNTTPAPGIDEQIRALSASINNDSTMNQAILATLRKYKEITEAPKPEPVAWILPGEDNERDGGWLDARIDREGEFTKPLYGPDLLAAYERMRVERDLIAGQRDWATKQMTANFDRAELAESQRDALVRLMREPDEEMRQLIASWFVAPSVITKDDAVAVFKAMSAVALRKVGV